MHYEMTSWEERFYQTARDFFMMIVMHPHLITDEDKKLFGEEDSTVIDIAAEKAYCMAMEFIHLIIYDGDVIRETIERFLCERDEREKEAQG